MSDELPDDERARMFTHYAGKAGALEGAAAQARKVAGEHFAARRDTEAAIWREVADWLEGLGNRERTTQKQYHPDPGKRTP